MKLFTFIILLFCTSSLFAQTNDPQAIYEQQSGTVIRERVYQPGSATQVKEITTVATEKKNDEVRNNPVAIDANGNVVTERDPNRSPKAIKVESINTGTERKQ